jgi:hypothetical protein
VAGRGERGQASLLLLAVVAALLVGLLVLFAFGQALGAIGSRPRAGGSGARPFEEAASGRGEELPEGLRCVCRSSLLSRSKGGHSPTDRGWWDPLAAEISLVPTHPEEYNNGSENDLRE